VSEKRWQPGDSVLLRNTGFFVGEAWATPHIVVQDSEELVVLYRPEGTVYEVWDIVAERLESRSPTRMDMLRLMWPGRWCAVELFFDTGRGVPHYPHFGGSDRFRAWKVNIEAPFKRFDLGFDTTDHFLDIIVKPDRSYFWKDHEFVQTWHGRGAYTLNEVERLYAAGRALEPLIEAGLSPFDDEWTSWQPGGLPVKPVVPRAWQSHSGIEITLGLDRRWDAWRSGTQGLTNSRT
jgi:hypothetical protein